MGKLDKNSVDRALEHFLRRIILTKGQYDRATDSVRSIETVIRNSPLCPTDVHIFVQGSFGTRTTLKPDTTRVATAEFDVDIAVESNLWGSNPEDAQTALNTIHNLLVSSGIKRDRLQIRPSCVRLAYTDGPMGEKFHVDIVPILDFGASKYAPKCTDQGSKWMKSDPGKLMRWFNKKIIDEPTFRAQYLLMKRFAQMNGIKMPSLAIQKITSDAYTFKSSGSRYLRELLDMCRMAVQNLDDPNYKLTNPVNASEDIRDRLKTGQLDKYRDILQKIVHTIEKFGIDGTYDDVAALFGDKFPKKESHENELSLRASGIYFDCDFADRVKLTARARNGIVEKATYSLTVGADHENVKDRQAVDDIVFAVSDIPAHHSVIWQVLNDPTEVPFQIRGNFEKSNHDSKLSGVEHRSEKVSYAGNHFVRAFIIRGNTYRAISNRFDVNVLRKPLS